MNKDLFRLLDVTERVLMRIDADWAVGGALAMAAHGYTRETHDIDVFIAPEQRDQVLTGLEKQRISVVTLAEDYHYILQPKQAGPEERVDLLFPYSEPDVSALAVPDYGDINGKRRPVWPLSLIVVQKLMGEREKDAHDLVALKARGMIDAPEVHKILEHMGEEHAIARLRVLMRRDRERHSSIEEPPSRPPRRR